MPLDLLTLRLVDRRVTEKEGLQILTRDRYQCQYCELDGLASFENALAMSVDFVVPRARRGKNDPRNLVACCRSCNMIKGTRIYGSFDEAKAYVLKQREELRKAWEAKATGPSATAENPQELPAPTASLGKSKAATASVIGRSPLSIRKG